MESAVRFIEKGLSADEKGIYRLVPGEDYSHTFGFQWNRFKKIQLDKYHRGAAQSAERFMAVTQWNASELEDKNILEVGSGAGRFTRVLLEKTSANIFSVDYSTAVDANHDNNGSSSRLALFQASVYELPFQPAQFDKVICFGVLQHTPDPRETVRALAKMVRPGGELIVDFYPIKGWYTKIHAKYILRPWTKRLSPQGLLDLIDRNIDRLIKTHRFLDRVGLNTLNRFLPICDLKTTLPEGLSPSDLREWAILDTLDMFSPAFDNPQKISTVKNWFKECGLTVSFNGFVNYGSGNAVAVVKGLANQEPSGPAGSYN